MTRPRANAARLTKDLTAMIAIPSVNPFGAAAMPGRREREMAEDLLARFAALGLESHRWDVAPGRPNVWGRLKGTGGGPTIVLAGHMDTVDVDGYPEGHEPRISGGRVYGRGACDMKAALACYLETVRMIQEAGIALRGDLIVAGICDEEDLMIGSTDWGRIGPRADFGIIGEPTGLRICPAHKGQLCVFFRTEGRATHSSRPELGVNAVEHMGRIIARFAGLNAELRENGPRHPLCGAGRFSMNVIRGGTLASAIPDFCEMEVDRRFLPGERITDIIAEYRARLDALSAPVPDMKASISPPSLEVQPLDVPRTSPLVRALERAVGTVCAAPSVITAFPGGTDAPNMGFPCVICGPGELEQAHSANEFVDIQQMQLASEVYFTTVLDLNDRGT
ncbi:MAG: M20/M25/M40 family metallo-hydrolase [Pseudomonadota bacterium]